MKKEIILREIRYYSKVYSPNCKKVKELKKRLTKLKKNTKIYSQQIDISV